MNDLPDFAIYSIAEFIGADARHISKRFQEAAVDQASRKISKAFKLYLWKSKRARQLPSIYRRHALRIVSSSMDKKMIKELLVDVQYKFAKYIYAFAIELNTSAPIDEDISLAVMEALKNNTTVRFARVAAGKSTQVLLSSIVSGLKKYKKYLRQCSLSRLINHLDDTVVVDLHAL